MNKRKANIFTVVEAVPNGFEAYGYTLVSHETVEGKAYNRCGPNPGALGPKLMAPTTTSRTLADWARDHPHTWLEATGPNEAINGPKAGNTGQGPEVTANRTEVGTLDKGLYPAVDWTEGGQVAREPIDVAGGSNQSLAGTGGTLTEAQVDEEMDLMQHPFWALLLAAGYEEV